MKYQPLILLCAGVATLGAITAPASQSQPPRRSSAPQEQRVPLIFSGGHDTDPRDGGRPIALVAGALGVAPEIFREAFRSVRPAPAGMHPDPQQVRQNKAVLLRALSRYGITNERLDTVSNYYRYVPGRGEQWPTRPATAYATVKNGIVTGYVVTDGGSGYSSAPTITLQGGEGAKTKASLSFSRRFDQNGAVASIVPDTSNTPATTKNE